MSKRSWRLAGWSFLALSLVAVLSLAAADFSEINQADPKSRLATGKNFLDSRLANKNYVPRTPVLVTSPQHLTRKIDSIPDCLQSS